MKKGKMSQFGDMDIKMDAILSATDILECISISQIQHTTAQDEHL